MDLNLLLELKKMARSTFYYHMKNIGNDDKYKDVKEKIATIFHRHKGRYGYRRVTLELRKDVHGINHKTVKRLMDDLGLKCEVREVKYKSYKGDVGKTAPNVIDRDFTADRPLQKVATDVTQINIGGSKIYLSPVLDMFNGEILSYVISESPNLKKVMDMLNQLNDNIESTEGMLMHSDLGIMKSELLYANKYTSVESFITDLKEYMVYYNNERIKLRLNGMSPVLYRKAFEQTHSI